MPPSRIQPGLPGEIETICLKCLEKQPGRRYATALELAEDLRRFLDGEPILAQDPPDLAALVEASTAAAGAIDGPARDRSGRPLLIGGSLYYNAQLRESVRQGSERPSRRRSSSAT